MKSTIRKILAVALLAIICLSVVACEVETTSAYNTLFDHLQNKVGVGTAVRLPSEDDTLTPFTYIEENASGELILYLSIQQQTNGDGYRVDIKLESGNPDSLSWIYRRAKGTEILARADATIDLRSYTGAELIAFDNSEGIPLSELTTHRVYATDLTNAALLALDEYCGKNLAVSVKDFGFVSLSSSFLYEDQTITESEKLGGAFSGARLSYALRMTLMGMVMVFAVLGLLWAVLAIFKKVFSGQKSAKPKAIDTVEATPMPAPSAPSTDDAATVAAITAAIAAMIESDPALRSQFAGGFRVVSFKKKSGKTAWNR